MVNPANERRAWQDLLHELEGGSSEISSTD
jgi:hypothetical protein